MARAAIDVNAIEKQMKAEVHRVGREVARRMAEPTSTWNHKPKFVVSPPQMRGNDLVCRITTDDNPFFWLDEGTETRHALMTRKFQSKTVPDSFTARPGFGGVALVSKWIAMPGIEPRNWTKMLATEYEPILAEAVDRVFRTFNPLGMGSGKLERVSQYTP